MRISCNHNKRISYLSLSNNERNDPQTSQTRNFLSGPPVFCFRNSLIRLYEDHPVRYGHILEDMNLP
jgi:hypothetical protein